MPIYSNVRYVICEDPETESFYFYIPDFSYTSNAEYKTKEEAQDECIEFIKNNFNL